MDWKLVCAQLEGLMEAGSWYITGLANASALLWESLEDINWAGFYLVRKNELALGPFQGKPACARIGYGKGVCGTAWAEGRTILVQDVHAFPGHIACDSASNAEIVIPLRDKAGTVRGVLDIDSPTLGRFTEEDRQGLEGFARILEDAMKGWEP